MRDNLASISFELQHCSKAKRESLTHDRLRANLVCADSPSFIRKRSLHVLGEQHGRLSSQLLCPAIVPTRATGICVIKLPLRTILSGAILACVRDTLDLSPESPKSVQYCNRLVNFAEDAFHTTCVMQLAISRLQNDRFIPLNVRVFCHLSTQPEYPSIRHEVASLPRLSHVRRACWRIRPVAVPQRARFGRDRECPCELA